MESTGLSRRDAVRLTEVGEATVRTDLLGAWEIFIDGMGVSAHVWFIPPAYVDSTRTPRLGGRARFDVAA